jgi:hypothetical protein
MDYDEDPYKLLNDDESQVITMSPGQNENCAILSIAWCIKIPNYLVTAQFNNKAVLWDVDKPDAPLGEYIHLDAVT